MEVRKITEEEVEKAVKKMKTRKAVEVDELSVEMVKANRRGYLMCASQQERYKYSGEEE